MTVEVGLIVMRALLYGGALMALGLPAYIACAPSPARDWLLGRGWTRLFVAAAAALALIASGGHLLLLTAAMNGVGAGEVSREMLRFVATGMPVGRAALVRLIALILLVGLAAGRRRLPVAGCIVAGAVAVASLAWNGHAMMHEGVTGWLHVSVDQIHLIAAALWLGGVVALLSLSPAEDTRSSLARREAFVAFSFVGSAVVATLVLTGVINTVLVTALGIGGEPARDYLALLGLKLAAFLGGLGLAAHNRYRLAPALMAALPDGDLTTRIRRSLTTELVLLLLIVAVVSFLGTLSPRVA